MLRNVTSAAEKALLNDKEPITYLCLNRLFENLSTLVQIIIFKWGLQGLQMLCYFSAELVVTP